MAGANCLETGEHTTEESYDEVENYILNKIDTKLKKQYKKPKYITHAESTAAIATSREENCLCTAYMQQLADMHALRAFNTFFDENNNWMLLPQFSANYMERLELFIRILAALASLEVPDYQEKVLQLFANASTLDSLKSVCCHLSKRNSASGWNAQRQDTFLKNLATLFHYALKFDYLSRPEFLKIVQKMYKTKNTLLAQRKCKILDDKLKIIMQDQQENSIFGCMKHEMLQFYPKIEELTRNTSNAGENVCQKQMQAESTLSYLKNLRHIMRDDFLQTLRERATALRNTSKCRGVGITVFEDVALVLKTLRKQENQFCISFADCRVYGKRYKNEQKLLKLLPSLEPGCLLCLSSSPELSDLVVVAVAETTKHFIEEVFLHVELLHQQNVAFAFTTEQKFCLFEMPQCLTNHPHMFRNLQNYTTLDVPFAFFSKQQLQLQQNAIPAHFKLKQKFKHNYDINCLKALAEITAAFKLNEAQSKAFRAAMQQKFCLINGPAGSGKTHLAVKILVTLVQNTPAPILLIAKREASLSGLFHHIDRINNYNFYRLGLVILNFSNKFDKIGKYWYYNFKAEPQTYFKGLLGRLYENAHWQYKVKLQDWLACNKEQFVNGNNIPITAEAEQELQNLYEKMRVYRTILHCEDLIHKKVIAMTVNDAVRNPELINFLGCSTVIFDDAEDILESEVLACLTRHTEHVIMLGHHNHNAEPAFASERYKKESLFDKLIRIGLDHSCLNKYCSTEGKDERPESTTSTNKCL